MGVFIIRTLLPILRTPFIYTPLNYYILRKRLPILRKRLPILRKRLPILRKRLPVLRKRLQILR